MELCLLNLILIVFCVILTLVCSSGACHMWLTRNHMFIREIWGKFTWFVFWNLSQISLLNVITSTTHLKTRNAFKGNRSELIRLNSPNIIREIWRWFLRGFVKQRDNSASIYRFKVNNNGITRGKCEICSKLTIKTPEDVIDVVLVFLLLVLNLFHTFF